VGTGGGLDKYDRKSGKFIHYWNSLRNSTNWVRAIYEEIPGRLWLGSSGGLVDFNTLTRESINYSHNPKNPNSISDNTITSLCQDPSGTMWVGTSNGLNAFNKNTKEFINYFPNEKDPGSLNSGIINTIFWERSGTLWIGTDMGLNKLNRIKQPFTKYEHQNIISNMLKHEGLSTDGKNDFSVVKKMILLK
jgi:ligand-binding sensor domain-containing protein